MRRFIIEFGLGTDFHGQDVLILYSTTLINGAGVLR